MALRETKGTILIEMLGGFLGRRRFKRRLIGRQRHRFERTVRRANFNFDQAGLPGDKKTGGGNPHRAQRQNQKRANQRAEKSPLHFALSALPDSGTAHFYTLQFSGNRSILSVIKPSKARGNIFGKCFLLLKFYRVRVRKRTV